MTNRIAILGAGVMGETLLTAIVRAGHPVDAVVVAEKRDVRAKELHDLHGVEVTGSVEAVQGADVVLLVVKPQDVAALLAEVGAHIASDALVISLAAGIPLATIEEALPIGVATVRAMPNTPALVGEGMFGVSPGTSCGEATLAYAARLLGSGGQVAIVDEALQDAVTGVSGSGPAYVFYLAEAMIAGGIQAGLDAATARTLAVQTLVGSAKLLAESDDSPLELRERVTSPHGTTAAAITVFDERGVNEALVAGVLAAVQRSAELSGSE